MANLQIYSLVYATVNGALLTEESSVEATRTTGSKAVKTTAKGYAGESPGAQMVEIHVTNAVPSADFEFNPGPFMASLQKVEVGLVGPAGKQLKASGFIVQDTLKHSVDNESTIDFQFRGQFADWE